MSVRNLCFSAAARKDVVLDRVRCAVELCSDGSKEALLSRKDQLRISKELESDVEIHWLPRFGRLRQEAGYSVETLMLIIVAGWTLADVLKSFVDGAAKEAGKDFWQAIKSLVTRTRATQAENSYTVHGPVYVLFELEEDTGGFFFSLPSVSAVDGNQEEVLLASLNEDLEAYAAAAPLVLADLEKFGVGSGNDWVSEESYMSDSQVRVKPVHVVQIREGKVSIRPVNPNEVFRRSRRG